MKKKIEQWKEEQRKIEEKQKAMNEKYNEQLKVLQEKIKQGMKVLTEQENKMIADAVREIYGEVNEENIDRFKQQMKQLATSQAR